MFDREGMKKEVPTPEEVCFTLTEKEWRTALRHTMRKAGPIRLAVQAAVLAAVGIPSLISFVVGGGRDGSLLLVGVASLALIVIQWAVPEYWFLREARERAAENKPLRLWFLADGIAVGGQNDRVPEKKMNCRGQIAVYGDLAIWTTQGQHVPIPKRVLSEEQWRWLIVACGSEKG